MKITFKYAPLLLLGIASLAGRPAFAAAVNIVNNSFEDPALLVFNSGSATVTGWNVSGQTVTAWGPVTVADGQQYLQMQGGAPGHADQTLGVDLLANTTYTLSYYVGSRADFPGVGAYTVALLANNVVLNSGSDPYTGPDGFMSQRSFSFTSGAVVAPGQTLQIAIDLPGESGNGIFDLITLDAETGGSSGGSSAPEPATLALSASAMLALGWLRRRRA